MSTRFIGIKLANGQIHKVLSREEPDGFVQIDEEVAHQLVVTTASDSQNQARIEFLTSANEDFSDAYIINSLILKNLPRHPSGEIDIEVSASLIGQTLAAKAIEVTTGFSDEFSSSIGESLKPGRFTYSARPKFTPDEPDFSHTNRLAFGAIILGALALAVGIAFFAVPLVVFYSQPENLAAKSAPENAPPIAEATPSAELMPPVDVQPSPAQTQSAPVPPVVTKPAVAPKPKATAKTTASSSRKAPQKGTTYKIRWGDTLWDLSYQYYRDPWLYRRISNANKLSDPDLIISGKRLWIPLKIIR